MDNLKHSAKAALNILNRVQETLSRIERGNGSASLLPTVLDQLRDAERVLNMHLDYERAGNRLEALALQTQLG